MNPTTTFSNRPATLMNDIMPPRPMRRPEPAQVRPNEAGFIGVTAAPAARAQSAAQAPAAVVPQAPATPVSHPAPATTRESKPGTPWLAISLAVLMAAALAATAFMLYRQGTGA